MAKTLYNPRTVASTTNRGLSTVYRDISQGRLQATRNRDGQIAVSATALRAYTKSLAASATR